MRVSTCLRQKLPSVGDQNEIAFRSLKETKGGRSENIFYFATRVAVGRHDERHTHLVQHRSLVSNITGYRLIQTLSLATHVGMGICRFFGDRVCVNIDAKSGSSGICCLQVTDTQLFVYPSVQEETNLMSTCVDR